MVKVTKAKNARGLVYELKDEMICGVPTKIQSMTIKELKEGDQVDYSSPVTTGKDGFAELEFVNGAKMLLGKGGELKFNEGYCWDESLGIFINLKKGNLSVNDKDANQKQPITITTGKSKITVGGTVFNVMVSDDGTMHTVQVFEGWVNFNRNMQDSENIRDSQEKGDEMKKLTEDFQAGKIGMQEYMQKMQELQKGINNSAPQNDVKVEAGFESVITETESPTAPSPLSQNAKTLWDDPEIK
jgi:hypothetical protein